MIWHPAKSAPTETLTVELIGGNPAGSGYSTTLVVLFLRLYSPQPLWDLRDRLRNDPLVGMGNHLAIQPSARLSDWFCRLVPAASEKFLKMESSLNNGLHSWFIPPPPALSTALLPGFCSTYNVILTLSLFVTYTISTL
jgi:hypothetical protein